MDDAKALSDKFAIGTVQARKYLDWCKEFQASGQPVDAASNAEAKALLEELMLLWWRWHALSNQIFEARYVTSESVQRGRVGLTPQISREELGRENDSL